MPERIENAPLPYPILVINAYSPNHDILVQSDATRLYISTLSVAVVCPCFFVLSKQIRPKKASCLHVVLDADALVNALVREGVM